MTLSALQVATIRMEIEILEHVSCWHNADYSILMPI